MGLYRGWRGGGGGEGGLCLPWIRVCMRSMPLCVSVEFLCLSVYQSVCLSKSLYMYMPACLHVPLSPLSPLSLSLSICGVDLADQGSRARYRVIQFLVRTLNQSRSRLTLAGRCPLS